MLLKCKDVAHLASDYLDQNTHATLSFKIRLHLLICANCRRFVRHLRITSAVVSKVTYPTDEVDAESVLLKIKNRMHNNEK